MAAITKQLVQQVDQWIARHRDEMVDEVCRLIRFPSVADPNGVPPYGQNCREVLDAYLEIGKSHGLAARNHDYHVGELYCPQWEGKPKRIGLMGHLDVVPAGEGWIYPPFAGTVKDGLIIGRGSQDNKGPSIAGLYTVLCLRDLGLPLTYDVCALAGTNEESGMDDARYYAAHCTLPDLILVTDSGFPVCYGERPVVSGKMAASRPFAKIHPSGRKTSPDWSPATRKRFWKRAAPSWKNWRGFRCRRAAAGKRRTKGSSAGRTASAATPPSPISEAGSSSNCCSCSWKTGWRRTKATGKPSPLPPKPPVQPMAPPWGLISKMSRRAG